MLVRRWWESSQCLKEERADDERKQDIMRKILLRIKNQSLASAVGRWSESVREIRTMAAKARKVMMRWMNYEASMCLDNWRETTVQEVRKRGLMKRIVSRMGSKRMSYAFIRSALDPRMDIGHAVGGMKAKLT